MLLNMYDRVPELLEYFSRTSSKAFENFINEMNENSIIYKKISAELNRNTLNVLCIEPKSSGKREAYYLLNRLNLLYPDILRFVYDGYIYSLISDISILLDKDYAPESALMMSNIGVYENLDRLSLLKDALKHAKEAIVVGKVLQKDKWLHNYRDLSIDILIYENLDQFNNSAVINPDLLKLDKTLLDTLEAFIDLGANRKECAAYLKIHRNTLQYRLSHIEKILGIYLDDFSSLYNLKGSLRILRILDSTKK